MTSTLKILSPLLLLLNLIVAQHAFAGGGLSMARRKMLNKTMQSNRKWGRMVDACSNPAILPSN